MLENARYCALSTTWSPHYDRYLLSDDRYKPSIFEIIEMAGKIQGLDGFELMYPQQVGFHNLEEIQSALRAAGLVSAPLAVSISSKRQYRGGSLTADDPEARREAIETVKGGMDLAASLGVNQIYLWTGRDGYDYPFQIDYSEAWARFVDAITEIGEHRKEVKVCLNYKIKEPRRWLLLSTAAKTIVLCEEVGLTNIGAMVDIGHSMMAYENPAESVALLAHHGRMFHTHFNDNTRMWDDDMLIASLNFLEIMEMLYWLDRVGYAGWLSFDPHSILEDPSKMVLESLRYVKGMISVMEQIGKDAIEDAIRSRQVTEIMALVGKRLFS